MNFPTDPILDQEYTYLTRTWKWNGVAWQLLIVTGSGGGSGNSYFPGGW